MSQVPLISIDDRVSLALGEISVRVQLHRPHATLLPTLPVEIHFWREGKGVDAAVNYVGLALGLGRATDGGGHVGPLQPLPVSMGVMGDGGGSIVGRMASWKAFVFLSESDIRALHESSDPEFGSHLAVALSAQVIPLSPAVVLHRQGNPAVELKLDAFSRGWQRVLGPHEWRRLLAGLGWPRKRAFELADEAFDGVQDFPSAEKAFRAAQDALLRGKRGEAIAKSRLIVDNVLREAEYQTKRGTLWDQAKAAGLPDEVVELIKAFKAVTSIEHHAPHDDWRQADAQFLLMLALALAEYAGTLPRRTPAT